MGYIKCVYFKCCKTSRETSMFRFPVEDEGRLLLWIRNSGNIFLDSLTNAELRQRFICAAHFPPSSIQHGSNRKRLIGPAIPIHFQSTELAVNVEKEADIPSSPECLLKVKTPTKFYAKRTRTCTPREQCSSSPVSSNKTSPKFHSGSPTRLSRKYYYEGPKKRLSRKCLFEKDEQDTPKRNKLKDMASSLIRKNNALRAQLRRLRKKSTKKFNEEEQFRSEASKTLALMQVRKPTDRKKWSSNEKKFCLSLFYKSPSAYVFLRSQNVVLASPSTIRRWLSKSNCMPGLSATVFRHIKTKFCNEKIENKACVICFDEMAIMSQLEYSKKYDLVEGFEDLGNGRRTNQLAKYALVFMIRGLYSSWKIPVAYFLSHSNAKAETLKIILKSLVQKLFDHDLLPKAVVCDQASTNQKLYKSLGVSKENPFFYCSGRKLFALFDVPHLIKNLRNNLLTSNYLYKDNEISFNDIKKTYELDKQSNKSRSLTKINDKHINPNAFQKMSVSLATQIFSNAVASAIKTAQETGQLQSETAVSTYEFIQLVNDMFDALNSRKRFSRNPHMHALSKKSVLVEKSINKAIEVFDQLQKVHHKKYKSGKCAKMLTRPPCFDGVVQSCNAVMQLFSEEATEKISYFLITNKLNQDVIENLFARFRQKGGCNRNPSARQLRTIFRSNLVNNLIKLPGTTNCEDECGEFININMDQSVHDMNEKPTSSNSPESVKKKTRIDDPEVKKGEPSTSNINVHSEAESSAPTKITLEDCSVAYFAGYLAKKCLDKFSCQYCIKNLIKEHDLDDKRQLLIINKSYNFNKTLKLKLPSDNLVQFLNAALDCFNIHFETLIYQIDVEFRLRKAILDFFKCEAPELLKISCEEHLICIINQMMAVKINFFCKNTKKNSLANKMHPKLRIIKNQ